MRVVLILGLLLFPAAGARADGPGDGLYGRFDGDLTVALGVGGGATFAGGEAAATGVVEARFRVLDAAGPVLSGRWGPDAGEHLFLGVELRPLFPALFLLNHSLGRERLDLFVQSLSVELGAAFLPLEADLGVGLGVGLGVEVPLVPPSRFAQGLWLRLGARHVFAGPGDRNGPDGDRDEWSVLATLAVKTSVGTGMAGREPPRYQR